LEFAGLEIALDEPEIEGSGAAAHLALGEKAR